MELYLQDAIEFVRARMDELSFSNDDMIIPADDDRNFDRTVEKLLPEAAEFTLRAVPAELLEPEQVSEFYVDASGAHSSDTVIGPYVHGDITDGVVTFDINVRETGFMRLVALVEEDSHIYITLPKPFNGPEARMQLNKYTRGTPDAPVLLFRPDREAVQYKYFSLDEDANTANFRIEYITTPAYSTSAGNPYIFCPERVELSVLNRLTGMVLDAYKETQHAQLFYQKSESYIA